MTTPMPAAFIGHGSPMNALRDNRYTDAWAALGASLPRPRALLVVSAHWYINATAVTAMPRPRTIHDFYGFPTTLFEVQYPAPGCRRWLPRSAMWFTRPGWARTSTAGGSTTAHGPCCCTPSPTLPSR